MDGWVRASECGVQKATTGVIIPGPSSNCFEAGSLIDTVMCHLSCPASISPSLNWWQ